MKLTITQAHNDKSMELVKGSSYNVVSECPTALAYCEAQGLEVGSVCVGYSSIQDRKTNKSLATLPDDLSRAVYGFTAHRPRTPILGTFELTLPEEA